MAMVRKLSGTRLVVASHNPGKVREIADLIAPWNLQAVSVGELGLPEPDETEPTFIGNALLKARAAAAGAQLPALADDSGLCVEALDGAPGIYSARWAGPSKDFSLAMEEVHRRMQASGRKTRAAWFICALAIAWPDGVEASFEGRIDGELVWPPRGTRGFGYDPMFVPEGHSLTFGEMEPQAKHAMSHRARAFRQFVEACLG
ncbi:MAG: RdgB/HAM1 family non-canonical purine NTP pyrophosphatase [Alphaproteobacteria bacterium]|nr:RdgB/HAM1 family non-canonical purine NTP pyrophosphatase [Alphaproteobacteria bacterium]